ncbi:MAG: DUF1013 domain-containing protein [Rhodospirillales bacterium]|nr:DUF1013 domain-containing protein [Rhodospirillales bacterium]
MTLPLMPKATAVWLVENTALTFEQIAEYCGLHPLEVQAIADGEVAIGIQGLDPVASGQLSRDEIDRCLTDPNARLKIAKPSIPHPTAKTKGARYTPVAKRQDRPAAIAWLIKNYPELGDAQICKLIGTTKSTISAVREKSHWNAHNIKPQNPVGLGICSEADLTKQIDLAQARAGAVHARAEKQARAEARATAAAETAKAEPAPAEAASEEPKPQ